MADRADQAGRRRASAHGRMDQVPPVTARLPLLPIVEWDCSPQARGVCLCLDCPDNMLGAEVKANATLVIGAGGGGSRRKRARRGVSIPVRTRRSGVLTRDQVGALLETAAEVAASLGDELYERIGTTCWRDVRDEGMSQGEVGEAMGLRKQRVAVIERGALVKLRARRDVREMSESVAPAWNSEGCRRTPARRDEG